MDIVSMELDQYLALGLKPSTVFGSAPFLKLNACRADSIVALTDTDHRMGIVLGMRQDVLRAPWSAPYCSVDTSDNVSPADIRQFGQSVRTALDGTPCRVVAPPLGYNLPEQYFMEGFGRDGDRVITDTSFHLRLADAIDEHTWSTNARRNLRRALKANLTFGPADSWEQSYNIIAAHHAAKGYHVAMTANMVHDTARILPVDFWMVHDKANNPMATMFCYTVRPGIVQIINLGDTEAGRANGAMTLMIRAAIDHYRTELVDRQSMADAILDYGPSSENGIQNPGLARYKSAVGFVMTPKLSIETESC